MSTEHKDELVTAIVQMQHPSAAALARGSDAAIELVRGFEVKDDGSYVLAGEELQDIQARSTKLNEQRMSITRPMDEAKKAVMELFRAPIERLDEASRLLKSKMLTYSQAVASRAREEQMRAEAAATAERDRINAEAAALQAAGRSGEAAVKQQVAELVVAAPVSVPTAPPKVKGVAMKTTIEVEVVDLAALLRYIVTGESPAPGEQPIALKHPELLGLVMPDGMKVRNYGRSLGAACNLPGVKVSGVESVSASRR